MSIREKFQQSALDWNHPRRAALVPPVVGLACAVLVSSLPVVLGDGSAMPPLWFALGWLVGYAVSSAVVAATD